MTGPPSYARGFTGGGDPARAVLACVELRRQGATPPPAMLASAQPAIGKAFPLVADHTLRVERLTDAAWAVLEAWAKAH